MSVKLRFEREEDQMQLSTFRVLAVAVGLAALKALSPTPASAPANIMSVSGSARIVGAPDSVKCNMWESNLITRVFQERSGMILKENMDVDITGPGWYNDRNDLTGGVIEAGTAVDSYLIHQDRKSRRGFILLRGSVTFDSEILGVVVGRDKLMASDLDCGRAGTDYPDVLLARGLELGSLLDHIVISADRRTIRFTLKTTGVMDQIRVITESSAVPAPGAMALLLGAGLVGTPRRRRA
jgi:hypothetical protein